MKIIPTPAREVSDNQKVQIGDTGREYPVVPTPPKAVSDKQTVRLGDIGRAF